MSTPSLHIYTDIYMHISTDIYIHISVHIHKHTKMNSEIRFKVCLHCYY